MNLNLPNVTYRIVYQESDDEFYGLFKPRTSKIIIDKNLEKKQKIATLCHEMVHAFDQENVGIKPLTESQTEKIGNALMYMIRHNDELIKYIKGE